MRKILPIAIVIVLLASGLIVNADDNNEKKNLQSEILTINSLPLKINTAEYVELNIDGILTFTTEENMPKLPKIVKNIELPFGARNVKVEATYSSLEEYKLDAKIQPAPARVPLIDIEQSEYQITNIINIQEAQPLYAGIESYPSNRLSYRVTGGLNDNLDHVTNVAIHYCPAVYSPQTNILSYAKDISFKITYEEPTIELTETNDEDFDLIIIAPEKFKPDLKALVDHKNSKDIKTTLKTTEKIYEEFQGDDKPEKIKRFIEYAEKNWGITYVLLVGGLNSKIIATPRDDANQGSVDWYVPVRYNNLYDDPEHPLASAEAINDPGVIVDLYYSDLYDNEGNFQTWDPNGDKIIAYWNKDSEKNDNFSLIDMDPDVVLGRLACRSNKEVKIVVDKIITYESNPLDPTWFKRALMVSGDGFLDQEDINIQWDTKGLDEGVYTVCGQSVNSDGIAGPIDQVKITIDRSKKTHISMDHDDYLRITTYPTNPITDITVPSNGNILGYNDSYLYPGENIAYCNSFGAGWTNGKFVDGVLHIKAKSYDPREYGALTHLHIWVENSDNQQVFSAWNRDLYMIYEGEWIVGEKELNGYGGAAYYLPDDFEIEKLFASNGNIVDVPDLVEAWSQGCGFAFLSGHGAPNSWGDHFPGIPGNRQYGSFTGLRVTSLRPWPPFITFPVWPMKKLENEDMLPIVLIGGCHNSQFNVSMIPGILDNHNEKNLWTHGVPVPECFSWYLISVPNGGAIATMGNTGLGYGSLGNESNSGGLDGGICIEFFKQYGQNHKEILGDAYAATLSEYLHTFIGSNPEDDHVKSLQQWVLLGDPTLKMGGYPKE